MTAEERISLHMELDYVSKANATAGGFIKRQSHTINKMREALEFALKMAEAMVHDAAPSPEYATNDNPAYAAAVSFRDAMKDALK